MPQHIYLLESDDLCGHTLTLNVDFNSNISDFFPLFISPNQIKSKAKRRTTENKKQIVKNKIPNRKLQSRQYYYIENVRHCLVLLLNWKSNESGIDVIERVPKLKHCRCDTFSFHQKRFQIGWVYKALTSKS